MLTLVSAGDCLAKQLTPAEALKNAQSANAGGQRKVKALGDGETAMKLAYTARSKDLNLYYVFNNTDGDGGFVILSADDLAPAVLGYVESGEFDYDKAPDNMKWWLSQYEAGISQAIVNNRPIATRKAGSRQAIWQLLGTTWDQDAPYNNMCPTIGGKTTYTGCVATAMAQIMYYHRWPEKGTGSHSYTPDGFTKSISADFGSTTYRWDDMLPAYTAGNYNVSQAAAVATLMYHCGVSVDMIYGTDTSGAPSAYVPNALISYFGYDKGMTREYREFYTDDEWEDLVYNELAEERPVYYSGTTDNDAGHAFVCDGYDGAGLFHFNWGWSGFCDGYFSMTGAGALNPGGSGIGGGTEGYGFTNGQACIIGVQKAQESSEMNVVMACPDGYTIECEDNRITRSSNITLKGGLWNYSPMAADVTIGIMFKSTTTDDVYYTTLTSDYLEVGQGWSKLRFTPNEVQKNGEYEVYPVYKPVYGNGEWKVAKIPVGMEKPAIIVSGDEPKVVLNSQAYVGNGDNTTTASDFTLHFSLKALDDYEGTIYGLIGDLESLDYVGTLSKEISMKAGESKDFTWSGDLSEDLVSSRAYVIYMCYDCASYITMLTPEDYRTVLFYVVDPTGISSPEVSADRKVNVYSMTGMRLRSGVTAKNALEGLPRGMYIVDGKKVVKK